MKRSELVEEIFDLLRVTPLLTVEDDKLCAEKIVELIEKVGMVPPKTTMNHVVFAPEANAWEPEDA